MNEQLLKDFIATAQKYNYDWNTVFGKFPELKDYDQQALKDYVATAEKENYNYEVVNSKFPEFGFQASTPQPQEEVKKKADSTVSPSGESLSALPSKPKDEFQLAAAKMRGEFIPPTGTLEQQAKAVSGTQSYMGMTAPVKPLPVVQSKPDEEKDYFEGAFGDVLRGFDKISPIGIGDFIDDMARSVSSGYRQGKVAEEADNLLLAGSKATPEEIQRFIEANKSASQLGPSKEMQDYMKTYEEEGRGFWGVVKGLAKNPTVIPEVLTSSLVSLATNTDALKAGATAVGTGTVYGAATGAPVGGVGALPGAIAGATSSIPYAFGLASSVVEAGSTFSELLQDQLGGKEMTKENVREILENPEKLQDLRNKAIARGIVIGTVDAFTAKLASGVSANILNKSAATSATGLATRGAVTAATAAGAGIESVGGSLGEATARKVIGQDMDVSEIALEGLAELPGGVRSTIQARLAKPEYKVNGAKTTKEEIDNLINTMSPADLQKTKIEIKNDYEGRQYKIQDKIVTGSIKEQVRQGNPELNEPSLNAITELEKELKNLEGNTTQTGKDKAAAIRAQIKNIQENQLQEEVKSSYSINGKEMSEQEFTKAVSEMSPEDVKKADIKANNATEGVTTLLKEVATRSGVESAPMMETTAPAPAVPTAAAPAIPEEIASLKDDEPVTITVKTLEEVPEEFRDRAKKSETKGTITTREKILGLPIGKKTTTEVDYGYTYTLTGKEAKDYAIQKSTTEESVLRTEQPEVELPTVGEGNTKGETTKESVTPAKPQEVSGEPIDADYTIAKEVNDNVAKENPDASVLLTPKGNDLSLTAVYVKKENRGKGIGTKVLETVKSEADRTGKKIVLDATNELDAETNLERLSDFYEKNGFKKVGENKFEYDPQEGVAPAKPQEVKPIEQELAELEQMFPTEGPTGENKGVAASDTKAMEDIASRATDERVQKVIKTAQRLTKTLKSLFPTANIYLHETEDSYNGAVEEMNGVKDSNGNFAFGIDANGKVFVRIDINTSSATATDVAHEVAHAVLQKAFGDNQKLFQSFQEKIAKVLSTESNQKLLDFANNPVYKEQGVTYEEYMVQLKALLSEQGTKLELSTAKKIAAVINEYVSRITKGAFKPFQEVTDVKQVIDFVNKVTDAMAKGEAIDVEEGGKIGKGSRSSLRDETKTPAKTQEVKGEEIEQITPDKKTAFNKGVEEVINNAKEYKDSIKQRAKEKSNEPVPTLFTKVSKIISDVYGKTKNEPNNEQVKKSYDAMVKETIKQYNFIVSKGLNVVRYLGEGEPYANSQEMLKDLKENKTLKFLPNEFAFGQNPNDVKDNIGLQSSGIKLKDGYELTNSEVFRVVHDYFGHGILGNQFGPIGEENATLQHLDLYSDEAAPAVIFQTRGQNSWVNFSGENARAIELRKQAKELKKQGKEKEAEKLLDEANQIFKFAEPKIAIFPNELNFKRYETARRIDEKDRVDSRPNRRANELSKLLETYSKKSRRTRGVNKTSLRKIKKIGLFNVNVISEYTLDDKINENIKKAFPKFKGVQKIYEITNGDSYRKMMEDALVDNPYAASVTIHSPEEFNKMRMFVTEDGSTGITLTKEGFLGGAFSNPKSSLPQNLAQLLILGIKEGATTAEAFDTILPDYYSNFGFKSVSKTDFNDEFKPMVKNGNTLKDWDYETYKDFNDGKPDVVFFIYDGGDRNTIEDRIGLFDLYQNYEKQNVKSFDKDGYDSAEEVMKQAAVKRLEFDLEKEGINLKTELTSRASLRTQAQVDDIVKQARASGYSEKAIEEFLNKRGVDPTIIEKSLGKKEVGTKIVTNEELMPGYDKMMEDVNSEILRGLDRKTNETTIKNNVMKIVQGSEAYKNATDQQRENITREVKKAFGEKMKSAPSAKKILGFLKDVKKVTMDEMSLLKQRLKDMAKGAKTAETAIKKASESLTSSLKDLVKKGDISTKQMVAVLRKFSKTNLLDDSSIEKFVNYMTKVFKDAEYADKISKAFTQLKTAKKNIKTKIGIAEDLHPLLSRIFSINPTLIPDNVFEKYLGLVDMFGQKKQVLQLKNKADVIDLANEIINSVDEELSLSEELAERFADYPDKVFDADGKLDFASTVKAMLNDETIDEKEADIMRKYKSKIVPPLKKAPKTDAELAKEKADLITALKGVDIDTESLPTTDEKEVARKLKALIRTDAINEMSNEQLTNLLKVIDNINNGYLPHYSQLLLERLNALTNATTLSKAINNAKPLSISKLYSRLKSLFTRKEAISEMVRRNPLFYIDQVFGNFKSKEIFNSLFKAASEAESLFKSNLTKIQNKLDNAQEAVAKSFGNDPNKTMMSKFKMMTYMIQLEYQSNPNSKQVNPASEYLKATIKHIDEGKSSFGERDADMLQKILDTYKDSDGNIDIDKLYSSFNAAEKKALATIKEVNESLREKAVHTASIIRGDKINPLDNYVHLNVLHDAKPDDAISGISSAEAYNNSLKPSTKAKSLIARTGKVAPLNFDVFASAQRGAKFLLMDYYLTEPIRTARKTINEATAMMEKDGRIPKEKRQILNAISNAFEETTENIINNNIISTSFADDVVNYLSKSGYRAVLASVPRFISELTSNVGFALFTDPKALNTGYQYRDIVMSSDAVKILNNVGSKQTNRIFPHETLAGRLIDTSIMNQASGIKGGRAKNDVANVIQMLYNNSIKKYKNSVETLADALISTPDKMVMRPMWIGSFANEFQRITGKKVDFEKIANNDEDYILENKDAIDDARDLADKRSVLTGATENPYMDILKGKVKPNQSALARAFNMFNNYMTRFTIYEYTTARTGIMAAMGNGSLTRKQGVALLAGVTTRMMLYTLLAQTLSSGMVGLFVDDEDEEDEKSLGKKFGQALASTFSSLFIGRDFGNATKTIINYGIEGFNEKFLDALREGDYDPYKDAIQYSIVPPDVKGKKTTLTDYLSNMGGPFGPTLKTADLIARKLSEEPKKTEEGIERTEKEMNVRIPLEILGNVGLIPLYKDIRKITMKSIYKDLEKAEKAKETKEEDFKPYGLNKEELKKYMPDVYEQYYGEGTEYAKDYKQKSEMREKKNELRKKMLDEQYNYIPEKKGGFGSEEFGAKEEKKKSKKDTFGSERFGSN